jgi:hypothetical protein
MASSLKHHARRRHNILDIVLVCVSYFDWLAVWRVVQLREQVLPYSWIL